MHRRRYRRVCIDRYIRKREPMHVPKSWYTDGGSAPKPERFDPLTPYSIVFMEKSSSTPALFH